jgi:small-conductance mechanosensitive channel
MDIKEKDSITPVIPVRTSITAHRLWIGGFAILAVACLVLYFLFRLHAFDLLGTYRELFKKFALAGFSAFVVLTLSRFAEMLVTRRSHQRAISYNMIKLIRLLSFILILVIIISFLFENWYTAAVSLGLISLVLGFALQTPISSLIGWLYIVIRRPYNIGDRIQINEFTGDVAEINYLDTTLWEFRGTYLTNDAPSGRLIRFPNSLVFTSAVINYSWQKFPFIWNEIPFHIAYESDLDFVAKTMREVSKKELGVEMAEKVKSLKSLIEETPIDELEIREYPFVSFRTNANTWLEATVTYLVEPKQATAVRSRLLKQIVDALLQQPDKVMFPKGNAR